MVFLGTFLLEFFFCGCFAFYFIIIFIAAIGGAVSNVPRNTVRKGTIRVF